MYGQVIEADPHALARKRPRDVHAQGFRCPEATCATPCASLVQRRARRLEFVTQAEAAGLPRAYRDGKGSG
jgi:hypothetical protein